MFLWLVSVFLVYKCSRFDQLTAFCAMQLMHRFHHIKMSVQNDILSGNQGKTPFPTFSTTFFARV